VTEVVTRNLLGEGRSLGMYCQPCADAVTDAINALADEAVRGCG
jgi:hypothetical protein